MTSTAPRPQHRDVVRGFPAQAGLLLALTCLAFAWPASRAFALSSPSISSISPTHGPATLVTHVTLSGTGFQAGATVMFSSLSATNVTVTGTRITCDVPTEGPITTPDTVTVTVTNPDTGAAQTNYTYDPPPSVSDLSPSAGPATRTSPVTVVGVNFVGTPTVSFGGNPATGITATESRVFCTAPTGAPGNVNVVVTNPDGQSSTFGPYTYNPPPNLTGVSPSSGPASGGTLVTVTGSGFTGATGVDFGGASATSVNVVDDGHISCLTPAHAPGAVTVAVIGYDNQKGPLANAYTYINMPPVLDSDPWANPAMVSLPATSTLKVAAYDPDSGPAALSYTWEKVTGPGTVTFSPNGTNAASTTRASFSAVGLYEMRVQISDGAATTVSNSVTVIVENSAIAATVKGDMDGNGKSDILLQGFTTGSFSVWPMDGHGGFPSAVSITNGGTPIMFPDGSGWYLVACGDFNNDGKQDLVFQNIPSGQIQIWLMDRLAVTAILPVRDPYNNILNLGANSGGWRVVACDDFTGDGRPELVLQNYASGDLTVWTIGGATYTGSLDIKNSSGSIVNLGDSSGGWRVVGAGDFNRDGKADLVFQNTAAGTFNVWFLNRTTVTGSAWITNGSSPMNLGTGSSGWVVGACADYNSDGKVDLVLQQVPTGAVSIWTLNGTAYAGSMPVRSGVGAPLTLGTGSGGWTIGGCGCLNGDGKAELLWQQTSLGALSAWATSGYYYSGSMSLCQSNGQAMNLGTNSSGWRSVGFADINRDGKQDLLLQNDALGQICVWFLNRTTFLSGAYITDSTGHPLSLGTGSGGWRLVGAADFNGDGKPDLFMQNDAAGLIAIWWLNGTTFVSGSYITDSAGHAVSLGTNSSGWRAAGGSAGSPGPGRGDIVFQSDAGGTVAIWFLTGSTYQSSALIKDTNGNAMNAGADSSGWRIRGTGEINGDGRREILWQHPATGYTSMWIVDGTTCLGGGMILDPYGTPVNLGTDSSGWAIVAPR